MGVHRFYLLVYYAPLRRARRSALARKKHTQESVSALPSPAWYLDDRASWEAGVSGKRGVLAPP